MSLNFPSSPSVGQIYYDETAQYFYEWDGVVWKSITQSSCRASTIKPTFKIERVARVKTNLKVGFAEANAKTLNERFCSGKASIYWGFNEVKGLFQNKI